MRACSVTSRPSASGRGGGSAPQATGPSGDHARSTTAIASGSTATFHSETGVVLPGAPYAPPMSTSRRSRRGSMRLPQHGHGQVRHRAQGHERQLARACARLLDDEVGGVAARQRASRVGQHAHRPRPRGPCVSGVVTSGAHERHLATERHLDVAATGQLQHGPGVDADLARVDVARDAGDGPDVGLGRGAGVQQREAVVDAGVAVDEQRARSWSTVTHRMVIGTTGIVILG